MNGRVQSGSGILEADVDSGRVLLARCELVFGGPLSATDEPVRQQDVTSTGVHLVADGRLVVSFAEPGSVHKARVIVDRGFVGNGLSCRLKIDGWTSIKQVLLGFVQDGQFQKLSIPHLRQGRWVALSFGLNDLAWGLQNGWSAVQSAAMTELQVHVQGTLGAKGGSLEVERAAFWDEAPRDFWLSLAGSRLTYSELLLQPRFVEQWSPVRADLFAAFDPYVRRFFPDLEEHAEAFMDLGEAPSHRATLPWRPELSLPSAVASNNSYRWSWHGLHPVFVLATSARYHGQLSRVFAARSFGEAWLEGSYYRVDEDVKYCWYDQGVGDRLYGLVLLWDFGVRLGFDQRFQARLLETISSHMRLLASEAFYSSHQRTRYHNHAVFQDLALMFASLALPEICGADAYLALAGERLGDQLDNLLAREQDLAVLVENSLSYHVGFQGMIEFAHRMMALCDSSSRIPEFAEQMARFTQLASYPDGRLPGHGDSPRIANTLTVAAEGRIPYEAPELRVLPGVGHAFVRGNHGHAPFMLSLFATSLGSTHKHEDNLSFTLYFDGVEWLIDPSFYCYEPTSVLARYLRSALAHNALVLPDLPYSLGAGLAQLDGSRDSRGFVLRGHHSAYEAIGVQREICGRFAELVLDIEDQVVSNDSAPPARALLMLHCGDGVVATLTGESLTLTHPASSFELFIRLPTDQARVFCDEFADGAPRGVTALGFMERGRIATIECTLEPESISRWQIVARRAGPIGDRSPQ